MTEVQEFVRWLSTRLGEVSSESHHEWTGGPIILSRADIEGLRDLAQREPVWLRRALEEVLAKTEHPRMRRWVLAVLLVLEHLVTLDEEFLARWLCPDEFEDRGAFTFEVRVSHAPTRAEIGDDLSGYRH